MPEPNEFFLISLDGFKDTAQVIIRWWRYKHAYNTDQWGLIIHAGQPSFNFTGNTPSVVNNRVVFNLSFSGSVVAAKCAVLQKQEDVDCEWLAHIFVYTKLHFVYLTKAHLE